MRCGVCFICAGNGVRMEMRRFEPQLNDVRGPRTRMSNRSPTMDSLHGARGALQNSSHSSAMYWRLQFTNCSVVMTQSHRRHAYTHACVSRVFTKKYSSARERARACFCCCCSDDECFNREIHAYECVSFSCVRRFVQRAVRVAYATAAALYKLGCADVLHDVH